MQAFGVVNAQVAWADGLSPDALVGRFDRIVIHGLIAGAPDGLIGLLSADGVLVAVGAPEGSREQRIVRLARDSEGQFVASDRGAARSFLPLTAGLTRGL